MRFDYVEPKTVEEAISLLVKHDGKAKIIAGGTDVLGKIRNNVINPEYVIDISYLPGWGCIRYDEKQGLSIGALTPVRALEISTEIRLKHPVLSQAAGQLGSVAIRNVATIGGNLCNAAPSAENAPALIALSAICRITGPAGERMVPLEDFMTGPGSTVLRKGELLSEIQVPVSAGKTKGAYVKHGIRGTIDPAIAGVAALIMFEPDGDVCRDIRIVLGAVAPTPMRAFKAEKILRGKKIDETLIHAGAKAASDESNPITDIRASAAYRREMVEVLTRQAIKEAMAEIG